tara:strand:+ start:353 stop:553 length:201 start_codon:yes stop_codon:yes gene_type:complete
MNSEEKDIYYKQFLDYTIVDYKIVNGFPILIVAKDDGLTYEVTVSKNEQGTEPGMLLGFPISREWG